jgi:hypothetical protein
MVHSLAHGATALWPPDDTEESIVGVDRHRLDIFNLRGGTNEEAHRVAAGGLLPWQAITQIMYLGCQRRDGSAYVVYPDMFVFPRTVSINRGSYSLQQDGAPVLIIEVASEATYVADLDLERGKAWSYAHAGVQEYLVLDPTLQFVPEGGRGWRLQNGVYVPWDLDVNGRWQSWQIGVAYGVEAGLAVVYGSDQRRRLREGEVEAALEVRSSEARLEAKRDVLRRLVQQRFGAAPTLEQRIDMATEPELDTLLGRLFVVSSAEAL